MSQLLGILNITSPKQIYLMEIISPLLLGDVKYWVIYRHLPTPEQWVNNGES